MRRQSFRLSRVLQRAVARANRSFDRACALAVMLSTLLLVSGEPLPGSLQDLWSVRLSIQNLALLLGFVIVWHCAFAACGLYRTEAGAPASTRVPWRRIVLACAIGGVCLAGLALASAGKGVVWH